MAVPKEEPRSETLRESDAQIEALKKAILAAAGFSLIAQWFAGDLPGAPLAAAESETTRRRATPEATAAEAA
jgi:hypothetical protein